MTTTAQQVTPADLTELFRQYTTLLSGSTCTGDQITYQIVDTLTAFSDAFEAALDGHGTDEATLAELREISGMCRDGNPHWYSRCGAHECPMWRQDEADAR